MDSKEFRLSPGEKIHLQDYDPTDTGPFQEQAEVHARMEELKEKIDQLQDKLYAGRRHAVLFLFQGMDCSGKDGTIRKAFTGMNPAWLQVHSFKAPTEEEKHHDFLWRAHRIIPELGCIAAFNRSYYEEVLINRVHGVVTDREARKKFRHINHLEELLADSGVKLVKIFLHISKEFQRKKLMERIENPHKNWKFDPNDLVERKAWHHYQNCYEDIFEECSTEEAPWYLVPSDHRWYRDYAVLQIVADTLEDLDLHYPAPRTDLLPLLAELEGEGRE